MSDQSTAIARKAAVPGVQVHGSVRRIGVSEQQYRRIVYALRNRRPERRIAQDEAVEESLVREVRALEFERAERQMDAVGVSLTGFLENVRHLHADIDRGIFEDLQECA